MSETRLAICDKCGAEARGYDNKWPEFSFSISGCDKRYAPQYSKIHLCSECFAKIGVKKINGPETADRDSKDLLLRIYDLFAEIMQDINSGDGNA